MRKTLITAALITVISWPAMAAGPYPNETCGDFGRGTWTHVREVVADTGATYEAIISSCGAFQGYTDSSHDTPMTVEEAIERLR